MKKKTNKIEEPLVAPVESVKPAEEVIADSTYRECLCGQLVELLPDGEVSTCVCGRKHIK